MKNKLHIWLIALMSIALISVAAALLAPQVTALQYKSLMDLGHKYIIEGKYEEAVLAFDKAIKIDKKSLDAYLVKAEALHIDGKPDLALSTMKEAMLVVERTSVEEQKIINLLIPIAEDLLQTTDSELAVEYYTFLMEFDKNDTSNQIGLINAYILAGEDKEALKIYSELERKKKLSDDDAIDYANLLIKAGLPNDAKKMLSQRTAGITDSKITAKIQELTVKPVEADLKPGDYEMPAIVKLSSSNGTKIYFTLDGSDPQPGNRDYIGDISLPEGNVVLKTLVVREDGVFGDIQEYQYNVKKPVFRYKYYIPKLDTVYTFQTSNNNKYDEMWRLQDNENSYYRNRYSQYDPEYWWGTGETFVVNNSGLVLKTFEMEGMVDTYEGENIVAKDVVLGDSWESTYKLTQEYSSSPAQEIEHKKTSTFVSVDYVKINDNRYKAYHITEKETYEKPLYEGGPTETYVDLWVVEDFGVVRILDLRQDIKILGLTMLND